VSNTIQGYAAKFGLSAPEGPAQLEPLMGRIAEDQKLPELAGDLLAMLAGPVAMSRPRPERSRRN
jgi:transposase